MAAVDHAQAWRQVLEAVRVHCWPFPGAVGLEERHEGVRQVHVVRDWCYLGSAPTLAAARRLTRIQARYDVDSYWILVAPLLDPAAPLLHL